MYVCMYLPIYLSSINLSTYLSIYHPSIIYHLSISIIYLSIIYIPIIYRSIFLSSIYHLSIILSVSLDNPNMYINICNLHIKPGKCTMVSLLYLLSPLSPLIISEGRSVLI
jgi:hypothetical protein